MGSFSCGVVSLRDIGDYGYDAAGNRTSMTSGGLNRTYVYDDDNRLKQLVDGGTTTTFNYDKNGSLIQKIIGLNTISYTYNGACRLIEVKLNGVTQASFTYDGDARCTAKSVAGTMTTYVNDTRGVTQLLQAATSGNVTSYVPGVSEQASSLSGPNQWSYFHQDRSNNRIITDNAASIVETVSYEPFGSVRTVSGAAPSEFGYAAQQRDSETGLINLRSRYYDPILGRFTQRDLFSGNSEQPQSGNRYSYALNNPLGYIDISGQAPCTPSTSYREETRCLRFYCNWSLRDLDGITAGSVFDGWSDRVERELGTCERKKRVDTWKRKDGCTFLDGYMKSGEYFAQMIETISNTQPQPNTFLLTAEMEHRYQSSWENHARWADIWTVEQWSDGSVHGIWYEIKHWKPSTWKDPGYRADLVEQLQAMYSTSMEDDVIRLVFARREADIESSVGKIRKRLRDEADDVGSQIEFFADVLVVEKWNESLPWTRTEVLWRSQHPEGSPRQLGHVERTGTYD